MLKKLSLSVSLLAGVLLKADVEPKITIQRGDAHVTLTKKEYVNHLDSTFKFLKEHEEESNLLKYFDKYENPSQKNLANFLILSSSILRVFLPEITKQITGSSLEIRRRQGDIFLFSIYALFLPQEKRAENSLFGMLELVLLPLFISEDIKRLINQDIPSINTKRLATIVSAFIPGFIGLGIKHSDLRTLKSYLESWSNFAKKNSIILSANEVTLYYSCYSKNINENLVLKQIQAYVDKISII